MGKKGGGERGVVRFWDLATRADWESLLDHGFYMTIILGVELSVVARGVVGPTGRRGRWQEQAFGRISYGKELAIFGEDRLRSLLLESMGRRMWTREKRKGKSSDKGKDRGWKPSSRRDYAVLG